MPIAYTKEDGTVELTYVGAVLEDWEENYYHDSDGYVIVWDEAEGKCKKIYTWTTRGHSVVNGWVDATPEVKEKAAAWMKKTILIPMITKAMEAEAKVIRVRDEVVVVKGRKIPHGTHADVFWKGPDKFKGGKYVLGLRFFDGTKVFTAEDNCEKVNVNPIDPEVVEAKAENGKYNFFLPFVKLLVF